MRAEESRTLDTISRAAGERLAMLRGWTQINSGSANLPGLARMAAAVSAALERLPGTLETLQPTPAQVLGLDGVWREQPSGPVLRLTVRPQAKRRVLLAGHMDTVFGPDHPFQSANLRADGALNAPGAADMKGGLLVMIAALEAFERSPWAEKLGYTVLVNSDEEVSSLGSAAILADAARHVDFALAYEPALPDGALAGARKGLATYVVLARGRAAHSGRNPQDGRNAVVALSEFLTRAAELNEARPGLTVNPARLAGGGPANVVPDFAAASIGVRLARHEDHAFLDAQFEAMRDEIAARREVRLETHGRLSRPPKPFDSRQTPLFEAVRACGVELGLPIRWTSSGGCCDGNNLAAAGLPVVDTLGVRGGAIHSEEEFMIPESLEERARLSALLLMRAAQGELMGGAL